MRADPMYGTRPGLDTIGEEAIGNQNWILVGICSVSDRRPVRYVLHPANLVRLRLAMLVDGAP